MRIIYAAAAKLQFDQLPRRLQERITTKLALYAKQPDPLRFAEPLTGMDAYRFRVGDYRIIFAVADDTLRVLVIKRRDKAYR